MLCNVNLLFSAIMCRRNTEAPLSSVLFRQYDSWCADRVSNVVLMWKTNFKILKCDWVVVIGTSICYFPSVKRSTSGKMPVWTSHLALDGLTGCCVIYGRLSYSCRLKVRLTGRLWLVCWYGCKWGFPVQTIPHVSSKRNAEAISFRGWQALSYCCASSFLRFPCQPLFTSAWHSQGSYYSKTCVV